MTIVVVDDDRLVGASLKTILEAEGDIRVAAAGTSGREAVTLFARYRPDVLLMDIRMEEMSGLEAAEQILSACPDAKILFLTTFSDDEYIVRALRMGARGYILKQRFDAIAPALRAVGSGQHVFGDAVISRLPTLMRDREKEPDWERRGVTERERELMKRVAQGKSNREIAGELCLSEGTVRNYLSVLLDKLGLRDRTQLAVFALGGLPAAAQDGPFDY